MFREDLADARRLWLDAAGDDAEEWVTRGRSDFLAAVDHAGRRAMFYSFRHSHGTALGAAGVPQKDMQASLNHTRNSGLLAKAVNALPAVLPEEVGAGGDVNARRAVG